MQTTVFCTPTPHLALMPVILTRRNAGLGYASRLPASKRQTASTARISKSTASNVYHVMQNGQVSEVGGTKLSTSSNVFPSLNQKTLGNPNHTWHVTCDEKNHGTRVAPRRDKNVTAPSPSLSFFPAPSILQVYDSTGACATAKFADPCT